jgi:hypothetical protein
MDETEAIKPILQLARDSANATVATIRTVVLKALSDPKVFTGFDEIKQVLEPKLLTLGSEGEALLRTLDLFSYGTHGDYVKASIGPCLALNDSQIHKLRQLTLLSLVHEMCGYGTGHSGCLMIPYQTLAKELGFTDAADPSALEDSVLRQVEAVVLDCVYARVLAGQMCQKSRSLFVSSRCGPPCRPRDVPLTRGPTMLEILGRFHSKLLEAKNIQNQIQETMQMQFDSTRNYHKGVLDRARKAETSSVGSMSGPALICGGGAVRGWSDRPEERRSSDVGGSASSRRQSKRSRGGMGGSMEGFNRY